MAFEWMDLLTKVAPKIASAIVNPVGAIKDAAMGALTGALGLSSNSSDDAIATAMSNLSGEQIALLRKAEMDFDLGIAHEGVRLAEVSADDRKDARARSIALNDISTPKLMAMMSFSAFFLSLIGTFVLAFIGDGVKISDTISYLLGSITSSSALFCKSSLDYFMGNNSESGIRDQMIYRSMPINGDQNHNGGMPMSMGGLQGTAASAMESLKAMTGNK